MKKEITLAPGVVIEPVGYEVLVMMPGNTGVLRVSGRTAQTLQAIFSGKPVDPSAPTVLELANQGIISTSGISRRGLITAGSIGIGSGIALLSMPAAMAANSNDDDGEAPIVFIQLNGYFDTNAAPGFFQIATNFTFPEPFNPFPDPIPSQDLDKVSNLSINGESLPLDKLDGASDIDSGLSYLTWQFGDVTPSNGDVGEFSWLDDDDVRTYYQVTFVSF